uniref:Uncharacterized protein n=1 Tax=Romanomermis culicivorax TaxID=13658 RepID=A0A915JVP2_ROMCU
MLEEGQLRYKCFYDGDGCWKIGGASNPINETIYNLAQSLAQTLYSMADTLAQKSEVENQQNLVTREESTDNLNTKIDVVDRPQSCGRVDDNKRSSVHDSALLVVSAETSRSSVSDNRETESEKVRGKFIRNKKFVANSNEKENVKNQSKIYLCSYCNEKLARKRLCRAGLSSREISLLIHEILKRDEERYGGIHCFCDDCLGVARGEMENCRKKCRVVRSHSPLDICENNMKMIIEYLSKKYK